MKSVVAIVGMAIFCPLVPVLLITVFRLFLEARYIPSTTMEPTIHVDDRLLVEKVKTALHRPYVRGEIIVFYPPPIEFGGRDLSWDPPTVLGRLTGLPFLPYEAAFIKRVVGLPGDRIRVARGQGIFVNDKLLEESSYAKEAPAYDLNVLGEIGGRDTNGGIIRPYANSVHALKPIVVPERHLFVLGDNRNNSDDSHVFGMLSTDRVIGRAYIRFYPNFTIFKPQAVPQ